MTREEGTPQMERRQYFRINDTIPLEYEAISSGRSQEPDILDPLKELLATEEENINVKKVGLALVNLLQAINQKLDHIIKNLGRPTSPLNIPPLQEVNISAGGVNFKCDQEFKKGELLKINIGLPPYPYTMLSVLGEVVRTERIEEGGKVYYKTATKFLNVDDETREDLMRYVYSVQRRFIKEKKALD